MNVMADRFSCCKFMNEHNYIILLRASFVSGSVLSLIVVYFIFTYLFPTQDGGFLRPKVCMFIIISLRPDTGTGSLRDPPNS